MVTNAEFVSRVANLLRANSKDGRVNKRTVLSIGRSKAAFLIAQKFDEMTMFKEDNVITEIPCFEFNQVEAKYCDIFEFRLCKNLMKSVHKLPEVISAKNGSGVVRAFSVDEDKVYTYTTPQKFIRDKKRKYQVTNNRFFYIKDGYMYLPDSTNELLDISVITLDRKLASSISSCGYKDGCKSVWEYEFICPERFYDMVVRDTVQELTSTWVQITPDVKPNQNENSRT